VSSNPSTINKQTKQNKTTNRREKQKKGIRVRERPSEAVVPALKVPRNANGFQKVENQNRREMNSPLVLPEETQPC
jgi:hypothetical protein